MSATVVAGKITASNECTTPFVAAKSGAFTSAWLMNTPGASVVILMVLALFKGCAICPFDKSPEFTSAPSTWYNRMSSKSGSANKSAIVTPNAVAKSSIASLSGANTVNVPFGSCKVAVKPAASMAAASDE